MRVYLDIASFTEMEKHIRVQVVASTGRYDIYNSNKDDKRIAFSNKGCIVFIRES